MDPIVEYGLEELPVHKSDLTPCPMATYFNIQCRMPSATERPSPSMRMIQGLVADKLLRIILGAPRDSQHVTAKAIELLYQWLMSSHMYEVRPRRKDKVESITNIVEMLVNYRAASPPHPSNGWSFTSAGGFSNCSFKYKMEDINGEVWCEGTLDQVLLTGTDVIVLDWKLGGGSQFSGFEMLLYTEATQTRMKSGVIEFQGDVIENELDIADEYSRENDEKFPTYGELFKEKEIVVELHQKASRFIQVVLLDFIKYKRRTRGGRERGGRDAGDYKGRRFYENPMTNIPALKTELCHIVSAIRSGWIWRIEGMHCWQCLHISRCFAHSPEIILDQDFLESTFVPTEGVTNA